VEPRASVRVSYHGARVRRCIEVFCLCVFALFVRQCGGCVGVCVRACSFVVLFDPLDALSPPARCLTPERHSERTMGGRAYAFRLTRPTGITSSTCRRSCVRRRLTISIPIGAAFLGTTRGHTRRTPIGHGPIPAAHERSSGGRRGRAAPKFWLETPRVDRDLGRKPRWSTGVWAESPALPTLLRAELSPQSSGRAGSVRRNHGRRDRTFGPKVRHGPL
jgi:hypothetical protein